MAATRWTFTLNNYTEAEIEVIKGNAPQMRYIIFGKEVGAEGTPHLQGYLELKARKRLGGVKDLLCVRVHLEIAMGTAEQNIAYCSKEGNVWTAGAVVVAGQRTDLDKIRQMANTDGMRAVSSVGNYQQMKVAEKFLEYNEEERNWECAVHWFWGATGTGKSRTAREMCSPDDTYVKNNESKWWSGYDKHEFVIIDDFRDSWWSITEMLRLLDRYTCQLEVKGGHRQLLAKTIIVTSCQNPADCYRNTGERIQQLLRRINFIRHFE